jgi:hypothetical protein
MPSVRQVQEKYVSYLGCMYVACLQDGRLIAVSYAITSGCPQLASTFAKAVQPAQVDVHTKHQRLKTQDLHTTCTAFAELIRSAD